MPIDEYPDYPPRADYEKFGCDYTKWITSDKRVIPIRDMNDKHLCNTIRFLQRTAPAHKASLEEFYICGPKPLGDFASEAFAQEFDAVMNAEPDELLREDQRYQNLIREAVRRLGDTSADYIRQQLGNIEEQVDDNDH